MLFSMPRAAASQSKSRRRRQVFSQPSSRIVRFTFSMPTRRMRIFVAALSLTITISLVKSSSVISMPVCIALSVPQEGRRSSSESRWISFKSSSPSRACRKTSIITGILMTLAATTGLSAAYARISPVTRLQRYTPVSPLSLSSAGTIFSHAPIMRAPAAPRR